MEVKNKEMFHYHRLGNFDNVWKVGEEIIIDNNFENKFYRLMDTFNVGVDCSPPGSRVSFDKIIEHYLNDEQFSKLELTFIKKLLKQSESIIYNTVIYNREVALEKYRKQYYPELPSRLHSIYLTDQTNLEFWKNQLCVDKLKLFKVQVAGNLFKSSNIFLPDNELTISELYNCAYYYWHPNFQNLDSEDETEYLFQGKVRVLEQLQLPYEK